MYSHDGGCARNEDGKWLTSQWNPQSVLEPGQRYVQAGERDQWPVTRGPTDVGAANHPGQALGLLGLWAHHLTPKAKPTECRAWQCAWAPGEPSAAKNAPPNSASAFQQSPSSHQALLVMMAWMQLRRQNYKTTLEDIRYVPR